MQKIIETLKLQPGSCRRGKFYVRIDESGELYTGANPRGDKLPKVVGFTSLELANKARRRALLLLISERKTA